MLPSRTIRTTYRLVPVGIATRNEITKLVKRFGGLFGISSGLRSHDTGLGLRLDNLLLLLGCWRRGGGRCWGCRLCLRVQRADLELLLVLLQDGLIVVLPELLAGILSSYSLEDLLTTRVLFLIEGVSTPGIELLSRGLLTWNLVIS
jgi:hypothetical protein